MVESTNAAGSRYNEGEAQLVQLHVQKLLDYGVQQEQIAIISPYNGQVEILRLALLPDFPKLQIRSVDGFQGGEREAVIISLVRSSDQGGQDGIGFLRDDRRLNVAVTRAKRHCCVICDTN
jgi:superfamily I DNA and/or RNA helicase